MTTGMVYNLSTTATVLTSLAFTAIPTTPQRTYVFSFVLLPTTNSSSWYLRPSTNFISITPLGGALLTIPIYGISSCLPHILHVYRPDHNDHKHKHNHFSSFYQLFVRIRIQVFYFFIFLMYMGIMKLSSIKLLSKGVILPPKRGKNLQLFFGAVNGPSSGLLDDTGNYITQANYTYLTQFVVMYFQEILFNSKVIVQR
jgi:hypothetical protein